MGSGKSLIGALVAERTGSPFHDLDLMIESEAGMPISDIFATGSEPAFRALETQLLPRALEAGSVAALGGGAVIDDASWRLVSDRAVTVYVEVPFSTIWERIRGATGRPLLFGRSREDVEALFQRRRPRYEQALHRVDGDREADVVVAEVAKLWSD